MPCEVYHINSLVYVFTNIRTYVHLKASKEREVNNVKVKIIILIIKFR